MLVKMQLFFILTVFTYSLHFHADLVNNHFEIPDQISAQLKKDVENLRQKIKLKEYSYWVPKDKSQAYNDSFFSNVLENDDVPFINNFLNYFNKTHHLPKNTHYALDCNAGSGRITSQVLNSRFDNIDMFQINSDFVEAAKKLLKGTNIRNFYVSSAQNFNFQRKYDLIWGMYVLAYLNDEQSLQFLQKCKKNLNKGGVLVIWDNAVFNNQKRAHQVLFDLQIIIRSQQRYMKFFREAQFELVSMDRYQHKDANTKLYVLM